VTHLHPRQCLPNASFRSTPSFPSLWSITQRFAPSPLILLSLAIHCPCSRFLRADHLYRLSPTSTALLRHFLESAPVSSVSNLITVSSSTSSSLSSLLSSFTPSRLLRNHSPRATLLSILLAIIVACSSSGLVAYSMVSRALS